MGIRETLNKNPQITTAVTAGIVLICLLVIVWQVWPSSPGGDVGPTQQFFTTDASSEQAALAAKFADEADRIPPFKKDGKDAYGILIYSCDAGKTQKVAYLWKHTAASQKRREDARKKLEDARKAGKPVPPDASMMGEMDEQDVLVFGQNGNKWISGPAAMQARSGVKFPCDGDTLIFIQP